MDGVVQSNVPGMLAVPPVRREALRACPAVIGLAVGADVIVEEGNYESEAVEWVALDDVESYPLQSGLRSTWPAVKEIVAATLR